MGILDEAIRQHLELKRQHGAESADLERIEKEAFGPATRPGDPEFADAASDVAATEGEEPGRPSGEEETSVAPVARPAAAESPSEPADAGGGKPGANADHPAPIQLGPEDEAEPPPPAPAEGPADDVGRLAEGGVDQAPGAASPEPPEAPERGIFDADEIDFGDLDLDLGDLDDAPPPDPGAPERLAAAPETGPDLPPAPVTEPAPGAAPPPAPERKGEEKAAPPTDEDLLEETPDFLQEAPDGEDLWFEQGPPRDFDFDDDDD